MVGTEPGSFERNRPRGFIGLLVEADERLLGRHLGPRGAVASRQPLGSARVRGLRERREAER